MSSYYATGLYGLGSNTADVQDAHVGPLVAFPWIDAAIDVRGVSANEAPEVPGAIRAALESGGATVDRAAWGGGDSEGGVSTRGKVYVRWYPDKRYGAVPYADIAQRIVASAAEMFPGALFILHRYRIDRSWPQDDLFVYPEGSAVSSNAPAAALTVTPRQMALVRGEIDPDPQIDEQAASSGFGTTARVAIAIGGGVAGIGLLAWLWTRFGRRK